MSGTTRRNRHDRLTFHRGTLPATLVEIDSTIDDYAAGTDLQTVLAAIHARFLVLEEEATVIGRFTVDAVIA